MTATYDFNEILPRDQISALKWEGEIRRLGDPSLLCLGIADMDFRPAPAIHEALSRVIDAGHLGYPLVRTSYYEAIMGYMRRRFDWSVRQDWIASNVAIYPSMQPFIDGLTEPGDEILYQPPVHHVFEELISSSGRVPVANPLIRANGRYEMDLDGLERSITSRTKLLMFCSPHNPVGRVWSREELERLYEIVSRHHITVLSDEVYAGLLYPGQSHIPFASLSAAASNRTVTMFSASKSFNLMGLKHSLIVSENPDLLQLYRNHLIRSNLHFGGSVFGLAATEAALSDCDDWTEALMAHVAGNQAYLSSWLQSEMPLIKTVSPEATYFAWLDCSGLGLSEGELVDLFERKARVTVTFGRPLGEGGQGHVRLNLGCPRSILVSALDRISSAISGRAHL